MSLARTIRNIRKSGLKKYWHDLNYLGDAKAGTLVGTDRNGNKFYEDLNEQPGRHRWVDYANNDFNASQVEPIWHAWLHHIKQEVPTKDPIVEASRQTWEAEPRENLTGTRAAFRTYSTTRPKIHAWEPKTAARS